MCTSLHCSGERGHPLERGATEKNAKCPLFSSRRKGGLAVARETGGQATFVDSGGVELIPWMARSVRIEYSDAFYHAMASAPWICFRGVPTAPRTCFAVSIAFSKASERI